MQAKKTLFLLKPHFDVHASRSLVALTHGAQLLLVSLLMAITPVRAEPITRLLVLGNSITWHAPNTALAWKGRWGMAASQEDSDFSHVIASMLGKAQAGQRPILSQKNISEFETSLGSFDFAKLKFVEEFQPNAVIIFLGDNVKFSRYAASTFQEQYDKLLMTLTGDPNRRLYCVSTWWANPKVDEVISSTCHTHLGTFVDIKRINGLPGMRAVATGQYSNAGVAAHPSDEGMQAIAKSILGGMKESRQ